MTRYVLDYVWGRGRWVPVYRTITTATVDQVELALAIHREQKRTGLPRGIERDRDGVLRWKRV